MNQNLLDDTNYYRKISKHIEVGRVMVFYALSAISWWSVLLVEETEYPEKNIEIYENKTLFTLNYVIIIVFLITIYSDLI